jgi:protein-S-isoprenylcysteine O-methyltransferase Ste14
LVELRPTLDSLPISHLLIGYAIASRLAYVAGIGYLLRQQERRQLFTRHTGVEAGFARFRRLASTILTNDGLAFVAACLVTRETLPGSIPLLARVAAAVLLVATGITIKASAARRLGVAGYYWKDFFDPDTAPAPAHDGVYRLFKNPMYTIGYAHLYGFALLLGSWPGLALAVFNQVAILVFNAVVETPHFERIGTGEFRQFRDYIDG